MNNSRNCADGQLLPSALQNPLLTAGALTIHVMQAPPAFLSEENQTICPRDEWRPLLRRLDVPFTTPRRGLNIVLASDLEKALRAGAKSLPKKIRVRAAVAAAPDLDSMLRANGLRRVGT